MTTIRIKMKSGSQMTVEAEGRCYKDRDGAGQTFETVEELACFWPGKPGKTCRREIPYGLYDVQDAEQEFWDTMANTH
jgi:hypothetical protein